MENIEAMIEASCFSYFSHQWLVFLVNFHFTEAKRILQYGRRKLGIKYAKESDSKLIGFTDGDWEGSTDDDGIKSDLKKRWTAALSWTEAGHVATN